MNLPEKLNTAWFIFRNDGPVAFVKGILDTIRNLKRFAQPDEMGLVFDLLDAARLKGVMIDVGAHWGSAMAPFARAGWNVYCFEPDSINRKRLSFLFKAFQNVVIDNRAVSDRPRERAVFYRSDESSGIGGLSAFRKSHRAAENVRITTLSRFFEEQGWDDQTVDFLKVDTEGFDFHVLRGFPWNRSRPRAIVCEFEDNRTVPLGYSFRDLAKFLTARGYRLLISEWWPVQKYNSIHRWRRFMPYPCDIKGPGAWGNIIAVQEERLHRTLLEKCFE